MIKKRLIGVITVKNGWAVQSFGYRRYLPLGRPETMVENFDRWGVDEILLQCIDRSTSGAGPDFDLLDRIGTSGLSTPLIYSGGIRSADDAGLVVQKAADRVCVDALLQDAPSEVERIAERLGSQAVIASIPVSVSGGNLHRLDYRTGMSLPCDDLFYDTLASGAISEALIIDWQAEGHRDAFDVALLDRLGAMRPPFIMFGGLSHTDTLARLLGDPRIVAVGIGNFLSYREHAVQRYKEALANLPLRPASFQSA